MEGTQATTQHDPLIHPDCLDPADEFEHRLQQLVTEGRDAGLTDEKIAVMLADAVDGRLETPPNNRLTDEVPSDE